jgi:hypothetical protein
MAGPAVAATPPSPTPPLTAAPTAPRVLAGHAHGPAKSGITPQDAGGVTLVNQDGRLEDFWVGTSNTIQVPGALWHQWQISPGSSNWSAPASLGGYLTSGIDGASNADGRLEVFGRAAGNDLAHIWQVQANGGWSSWASLGGVLASGPFTSYTSYGGIIVDVFGPDNRWHRKYQMAPNCCWSGWV